ncbi:MAG TPA: peptidoglycan DD-metalloendopeptidase family protein [Acidimicrobiales bacterium]|nr:peptidoglycan DD-metalloendopeptidase family protein [Acidimicrobiales bacterium]
MRCPASAPRAVAALVALATVALLVSAPGAAAAEPAPVAYQPPVDAPVVDTFRPPRSPYGAGNRGVDYASVPGTPVRAAAPGIVAFAGQVGGTLHAVVLHADGIRSSYSFLRSVGVRRGQRLGPGQVVGTAGPNLHFGARAGEAYLDPLVLLAASATGGRRVFLVPEAERKLQSEERERRGLLGLLARVPHAAMGVGSAAVAWARQAPGAAVSVAASIGPGTAELFLWARAVAPSLVTPFEVLLVTRTWWDQQSKCTPAAIAPPPPSGRRIAVLVAGLGSTSDNAAIYEVDTATLGYAAADVYRYSYRGGSTADTTYGPEDTQVDIAHSGRRLRALVERLHADHPGVPIDILAHSQGGIVTRSALGQRAPPGVENVVTLGSPHEGADLATAAESTGRTPKGAAVQWAVDTLNITGINPRSVSVRQLSETSDFMRDLNSLPVPDGVRFTSVAARADVVVPSPRSRLPGATYVVVDVPTINHHNALPGSDAATREIGLARAGMEPTCEGLGNALADFLAGRFIATTEDAIGVGLTVAGAR